MQARRLRARSRQSRNRAPRAPASPPPCPAPAVGGRSPAHRRPERGKPVVAREAGPTVVAEVESGSRSRRQGSATATLRTAEPVSCGWVWRTPLIKTAPARIVSSVRSQNAASTRSGSTTMGAQPSVTPSRRSGRRARPTRTRLVQVADGRQELRREPGEVVREGLGRLPPPVSSQSFGRGRSSRGRCR